MKLKNLKIRNVGVHKHLEVQFGDGLTGIFGPQGSGKSTVIGCVYAAITNDFSRISDLKQNAVCQQAEEKDSSLSVVLEANGNQVGLTRVLAPNASNRLKTSTGLVLTNDNKIKEEMAGILGASRGLLDNYVFVDQWEIRSLFKANLSQRNEALALLCGTKFIDACYGVVTKARDSEKEALYENLEDAGRLKAELSEYKTLLTKESKALAKLKGKLLSETELKSLADAATNISAKSKAQEDLKNLNIKIKGLRDTLRNVKGVRNELFDSLAQALEASETQRSELELTRLNHGLYGSQLARWTAKAALLKSIRSLEASLEKPPPVIDAAYSVKDCDKEIDKINEEIAPFVAIIDHCKKLPDSQTCPTCGSTLSELKAKEKEAVEKIGPYLNKRVQYAAIRTVRQKQEEALKDYLLLREVEEKNLEASKAELELLSDVTEPAVPDTDLEQLEQAYNVSLKAQERLRKEHAEVAQGAAKIASTIEHLSDQKAEVEKVLEELASIEASDEDPQEILKEDRRNRELVAASVARCEEYQKVIEAREQALEKIEALKAKSNKTRLWADLLARAATVLHKDGLPHIVHSRALREVEAEVNKTLAEFESPFRIKTGDNLTYIAKFCNGTEVPAHRLSGGQQVILSLAMRWALNSLFASQIGFLALDEPTAGLDEQHLGLLQSTLSKLGAAARNRGCQVVIITHEKRLMGVFDHVIELNRPVL